MKSILFKGLTFFIIFGATVLGGAGVRVDVGGKLYSLDGLTAYSVFGDANCDGVAAAVDKLYLKTYRGPRSASIILEDFDLNKVSVREEVWGSAIDRDHLIGEVKNALSVGGGTVSARLEKIKPNFCAADLKGCLWLKGGFTTYFDEGQAERSSNIRLAAKALDGVNVYPGEVLSFNDAVGERTEARGFLPARVIVGGEISQGVGGGVCQLSTTVYNAALLSGLEIREVHRHSLAVGYAKKSFDAMVSFGFADLKIKNCGDTPCAVFVKVEDGAVKVKIFGERLVKSYSTQSVVLREIAPSVKKVVSPDLAPGETRYAVYPKNGYESEGYLIIKGGGIEERVLIRKDVYMAVDGVLEVGDEG